MANEDVRISFDALLSMIVSEADDRELRALPSLDQLNRQYKPTPSITERIQSLIKKEEKKERRHTLIKHLKRVLVTSAFCLSFFTCIMLPVNAVQEAVISTIIQWRDEFAVISFTSPSNKKTLKNVQLQYAIEGFATHDPPIIQQRYYSAVYWNKHEECYTITAVPATAEDEIFVDNEDTQYYLLKLDALEVLWIVHEAGDNVLLWEQTGYTFCLTGTTGVPISELINVIRGVSF